MDLVTSDDHAGLVRAIRQHFQSTTRQRGQTHLTRNILDACPKALQDGLKSQLRVLCTAPDIEPVRQLLPSSLTAYDAEAPQAMQRLEHGFDDATAVLAYPEPYRKRLRTANIVERQRTACASQPTACHRGAGAGVRATHKTLQRYDIFIETEAAETCAAAGETLDGAGPHRR